MSTLNIKIGFAITYKKNHKMPLHSNYIIRWQNFKAFADTGEIELKPITIIIGPNNSGKSSLIAPLLLMNQTISSFDGTTPLIISGNVYDGGNIRELLHNYNLQNNEITLSFKYHFHKKQIDKKEGGKYFPGACEINFQIDKDRSLLVKSQTIYDIYFKPILKIFKNAGGNYQISGVVGKKLDKIEKAAIKKITPVNFLFSPNTFLSEINRASSKNKNAPKKLTTDFTNLLQIISMNFSMMRGILGEISFIGPIREHPHRFYELKNINHFTVGARGENVPELLNKHLPQIQSELNKWVKKFGFGDELIFDKVLNSKSIRQIQFKNKGETFYTNIANAGFGASQIIPLIIQALVSGTESLTIAEQPEIHLNPKLQGALAELFVYMAKKDQRIIVETHSEHLLLRLRTLVAKKEIGVENIAIYYVEKVDGKSKIREIKMDENGGIASNDWPDDFFEDTLKESIDLATQQAKNMQK